MTRNQRIELVRHIAKHVAVHLGIGKARAILSTAKLNRVWARIAIERAHEKTKLVADWRKRYIR